MSLDIQDVLSPRFTMMNLNAPFILKPPTSEYAFLPEIDMGEWNLAEKKDHSSVNGLAYSDLIYERK